MRESENLTEDEIDEITKLDWHAIVFADIPSRLELGFHYGRRSFQTVDNDAGQDLSTIQYGSRT